MREKFSSIASRRASIAPMRSSKGNETAGSAASGALGGAAAFFLARLEDGGGDEDDVPTLRFSLGASSAIESPPMATDRVGAAAGSADCADCGSAASSASAGPASASTPASAAASSDCSSLSAGAPRSRRIALRVYLPSRPVAVESTPYSE